MSEQPEFFTYTRDEFLDEFVHPDDRAAVEDARQKLLRLDVPLRPCRPGLTR